MPRIISGLDKDPALECLVFYLGRLKTKHTYNGEYANTNREVV